MANAWDALLASAQPGSGVMTDSAPNPEYDNLMGLAPTANDDPVTAGLKQANSIIQRNTPEGRSLTMEIAKSKLANQMAIQLEQAKIDLAKANPEYDPHVTPWGGIVMTTKYSPDVTESYGGAEGAKDAYTAKLAAETATSKTQASPEYQAAALAEETGKPALQTAQTAAANAMPGLREAMINRDNALANSKTAPKPWTTEDSKKVTDTMFEQMGVPTKPDAFWDLRNPGVREKATAAAQAEIAKQQAARTSGSAGAPAPAPTGPAPDISNLLNLSNGLNPNQGLLDQ